MRTNFYFNKLYEPCFLALLLLLSAKLHVHSLDSTTYVTEEKAVQAAIVSSNYNPAVPPGETISPVLTIFFKQINNIDEKLQTMNSSSTVYVKWTDSRLIWTPSDYQDIQFILISGRIKQTLVSYNPTLK
jgi:hypothetical protein